MPRRAVSNIQRVSLISDASVFESSGKRSKAGAGRTYTKQEREDALQAGGGDQTCACAALLDCYDVAYI